MNTLDKTVDVVHEHEDSLYINADFNIFTKNLIARVEGTFDKSIERDKTIKGLKFIKSTHDEITVLRSQKDKNNVKKINELKHALKLNEIGNIIMTKQLWNNLWFLYNTLQTSIEDRGGFVVPSDKVIKKGEDFFLVKVRGCCKVEVAIQSECNKKKRGIKVRSYFTSDYKGKFIRGSPNYVEYIEMKKDKAEGLRKMIKSIAIRELKEETLIDLNLVDNNRCIVSAFGSDFKCYWTASTRDYVYKDTNDTVITYSVNVNMTCNQYEGLKKILKANAELIQKHIEEKSEISDIIVE